MPRHRPFAQVDVFSAAPYRGNPVAVILDGTDLADEDMLAMARWTNLSETTFILPPTAMEADYRLRIFTPGGELLFAGHPTLGSAHAWLTNGNHPRRPGEVTQECGAGLVRLRIDGMLLSFAAPPTLQTGPLTGAELDRYCRGLRIDPATVVDHQWVDNGPGWAVIRLATAREVLDLEPDLALIPDAMIGVIGPHPDGSPHALEMRTFAPGVGVPEDPVCGSMNASVAQWLIRRGEFADGYRVAQGTRVGRSGEIVITADPDGSIWVGGATHTLFHGHAVA